MSALRVIDSEHGHVFTVDGMRLPYCVRCWASTTEILEAWLALGAGEAREERG